MSKNGSYFHIETGASGLLIEDLSVRLDDHALVITTDSLVSVPDVVVALITVSILGTNLTALMIAVIAVGWLPFARLSFELASRVLRADYAVAAELSGASPARIAAFTLLPNVARPLIAHAFLRFPGKLLLLSGPSRTGSTRSTARVPNSTIRHPWFNPTIASPTSMASPNWVSKRRQP